MSVTFDMDVSSFDKPSRVVEQINKGTHSDSDCMNKTCTRLLQTKISA